MITGKNAREKDMTFGDVVKHYKPDVSKELIEVWMNKAINSCLLKHGNLHSDCLVPEIYYVSKEFI